MSPVPRQPKAPSYPESPVRLRELRLFTGLVLGAFILTHFSNHALGLVSVEAMEQGRWWFNLLWRNPVGTIVLYGSLLIHFALALEALMRRRTLRMPLKEASQLVLGLALPFLLIPHVTGTRIELALTGREVGYPDVVQGLWILNPENGVRQAVALLVVWLHFCLGIYFWLRPKNLFPRFGMLLYAGALLVPVLALLGFAQAGKDLTAAPERFPFAPPSTGAEAVFLVRIGLYLGFAAPIGAVLAARGLRYYRNLTKRIRITYPGPRTVTVLQGFSVLEASRQAGFPHLSTCGGRGRCSTCRIRVVEGHERQPPPSPQESATLARIKAGPDVRLACQLRPTHDLSVIPVLTAGRTTLAGPALGGRAARGRERQLAVLFCDLRGFTSLTERRLPFDTVYILNRYFEVVGQSVERAGGYLDKFIGDGALALFGLSTTADRAARQAFDAALSIRDGMARLNETYASELDQPLQVVIGLHAGPAIVGEMGYGLAMGLTAVGDMINTASRLEGLAKDLGVDMVVSAELASRAGLDLSDLEKRTVQVRGRAEPMDAWIVPNAESLRTKA